MPPAEDLPVLVTGCAGFIGSHVTQELMARGFRVVGLDNFDPYYSPLRKRANLAELDAPGERFLMVEGDLRDQPLVRDLFERYRPARVVHLAAMAGVRNSIENPALYMEANLMATLGLLELARDAQVENFVFASTSSVYGATRRIPFQEDDPCDRPLAPYPASKRAAEMLGFTFHHLYGMNFTALRFFTVYGPRGRPDMMPYKVLDSIFFGRDVPLYRGGDLHRDWTHVRDVAFGVAQACERPLGYAVMNVGRGEPVRVRDFVARLEELAGRKACLTPAPMMDTDMEYTCADVSRARELLDYRPRVSVPEGTRDFFEWYRAAVLEQRAV